MRRVNNTHKILIPMLTDLSDLFLHTKELSKVCVSEQNCTLVIIFYGTMGRDVGTKTS